MASSFSPLNWGVLGTGRIAGVFTRAVAAIPSAAQLVAVGSRNLASAKQFAAQNHLAKAYDSYESLLADPEVQAVYIGTPHSEHCAWALKAIAAGKHVLSEKPAGMNRDQVIAVVEAAKEKGVIFMEAFMYRFHPQTSRVREFIESGSLGRIGLVQGSFGFNRPCDTKTRLWNRALGGGGIMDVGCYPVSWARLVAGADEHKAYADPVTTQGSAVLHPEAGVDVYAAATLRFPSGMIAQVSCGIGLVQDNTLRIFGETGWLELSSAFVCECAGIPVRITLHRPNQPPTDMSVTSERDLYTYEIEAFAKAVSEGLHEVPGMTLGDTLGNMATLDAWRSSAGVMFPGE
jgi:predicted dehydrogenase